MSIHRLRVHPEFQEGCFGCKVATVSLSSIQISGAIKATDRELDAYRSARKYGIQPKSTKMKDITHAVQVSEATGRAAKA